MPVYNPPKQSSLGGVVNTVGDTATSAAGILAMAGAPTGGMTLAPAIIAGAVGGIAKLAGTFINGNQEDKLNKYNEKYKTLVEGEQNVNANSQSVQNSSQSNYTQEGVNQSLKSINKMMTPTASINPSNGGTGIVNNRLI